MALVLVLSLTIAACGDIPTMESIGCTLESVTGTLAGANDAMELDVTSSSIVGVGGSLPLAWPRGWTVRQVSGVLEVINASGNPWAREGDTIRVSAQSDPAAPGRPRYIDGRFVVCG